EQGEELFARDGPQPLEGHADLSEGHRGFGRNAALAPDHVRPGWPMRDFRPLPWKRPSEQMLDDFQSARAHSWDGEQLGPRHSLEVGEGKEAGAYQSEGRPRHDTRHHPELRLGVALPEVAESCRWPTSPAAPHPL